MKLIFFQSINFVNEFKVMALLKKNIIIEHTPPNVHFLKKIAWLSARIPTLHSVLTKLHFVIPFPQVARERCPFLHISTIDVIFHSHFRITCKCNVQKRHELFMIK